MIKRGWHNHIGFVYSDWLSFGSELGQHLGQGTKTEWKLLFSLLAQATNVTAGTERTAASVETSILVGQRLHCETLVTLPRKGLASELSTACCLRRGFSEWAGASGVFVPKGASWFLAPPLFLGRKPLCGCLLCSWRLLPFIIKSASLPLPWGLADPFSRLLWYCGLNLRLWLEDPFCLLVGTAWWELSAALGRLLTIFGFAALPSEALLWLDDFRVKLLCFPEVAAWAFSSGSRELQGVLEE